MSDLREADKWLENNPICDADDLNKRERELVNAAWQAALSANGGEVAKSAPHSDYGYIPSKDHQWFFYDPEGDGMTFCKTEEEALSGADQAILQSLDECWSECVDQICYGKIVQAAAQVDRVDRPENVGADGYTPDGVHWPQDCELMCNYRLESVTHPAPPSVAVPEGWDDDAAKQLEQARQLQEAQYGSSAQTLTAAPSPDHIADAGKVVPIGYLTNQAVARLQSDKRLNGEHLYAFKPDDLSKFQAVCLAPTVNESLTIEDFNGMCRIVEAVSQMTDGLAIDQCHIDRAREIVQDAARLRTAGDEGEA